jgi:hypothetical protein
MKVEILALLSQRCKTFDLTDFESIIPELDSLVFEDDLSLYGDNAKMSVLRINDGFMISYESTVDSEEGNGLLLAGNVATKETTIEVLKFFFDHQQPHTGYEWDKVDPEDDSEIIITPLNDILK